MAQILKAVLGHKNQIANLLAVARANKLGSSYLCCGSNGIGKKRVILGIIQNVLCLNGSACGECAQCLKVERLEHEEVLMIAPEATQIKLNQAEEIHRFLNLQKMGKHRFIVIDDAHLLNPQAANSLLKILEEPSAGTTFFLIAPSDQAVLKTLRSRSQVIYFSNLSFDELRAHTDHADWMLRSSQGRMDLLDQLKDPSLIEARKKYFEILKVAQENNFKVVMGELKETLTSKESALQLTAIWQQVLRDILLYQEDIASQIHADQKDIFDLFKNTPQEKIHNLFQNLLQIERDIYANVDRNLAFENFILNLRSP